MAAVMRARNLAAKTVRTYADSLAALVVHADATHLAQLDRRAVEELLAAQAAAYKPATVSVRFRALQQWFKWLV